MNNIINENDLRNTNAPMQSSPSERLIDFATPANENCLEPRVRKHVLVADDSAVSQILIKRMLEKRGLSVTVVGSGRMALNALKSETFDAVLIDIHMPEMDGFEVTAAIRLNETDTGEHVPIFALTATAVKGFDQHCIESGMDGYLSKPVQGDELFATIESIL